MPGGLYANFVQVERFATGAVSAGPIATPYRAWVAPVDFEVIGLTLSFGTAPGTTLGAAVNIQNTPTSQMQNTGTAPNPSVAAYNLWTTANQPTIIGSATAYPAYPATYPTNVAPQPYAQNYPFPGPAGTTGFTTAQQTALTTSAPVTAPPVVYRYGPNAMVAPDATYTDYNNVLAPANIIHAGDVLLFNIIAAGTGIGGSNLEAVLLLAKR
jgi:hypothetical protein